MKERNKRVLVGMSGGIDSTATCLMLQEQGYEIVGVTMRVWGDEPQDARELAARMGIEHYVADERIPFKETIVRNFIDEYKQGRTPNPCVMCNPLFKFRVLAEWADKLNCAYIATGHYSRLEERNGHIYIVAGDDDKKDQSYFLWQLGQDVLRRCIFPLGDYTKIKVREYLAEKGYEAKSKEGESMEVCFIQGDYRDFLREQCPELDTEIGPGWFVSSEGVKLGQHKGAPYYTIGQRKGLGVSANAPLYVLGKDPDRNAVILGEDNRLYTRELTAERVNWLSVPEPDRPLSVTAKTRYSQREAEATAEKLKECMVKLTAKAGSGGRLFGAVTSKEISDALKEQFGLDIAKTKIVQDEPIKAFGGYELKVKLGYEVTGTLKVVVAEA